MSSIPFAIQKPATYDPRFPDGKYGYTNKKTRVLADIEYVVYHSAEGNAAFLERGHRAGQRASWLASVLLDGTLWQHYPLEAPTWTSGTMEGNIAGLAVEFEGTGTTPITDAQVDTAARLFGYARTVCSNLKEPQLLYGFQEHRILTNGATSCPSGRIRWSDIKDALPEVEEPMAKLIQRYDGSPGGYYLIGTDGRKRGIENGTAELKALVKAGVIPSTTPVRMTGDEIQAIPSERELA